MTWTKYKEKTYRTKLALDDSTENPSERAACAKRITEICAVIECQIFFVDRVATIRRHVDELTKLLKALK